MTPFGEGGIDMSPFDIPRKGSGSSSNSTGQGGKQSETERQNVILWCFEDSVLETVCLTCAFMRFTQDSLKTWEFLDPLFCSFHSSYSVYSSTDKHSCAISEHFAPSDVHLKSRRPSRQISRFNPRLCVSSKANHLRSPFGCRRSRVLAAPVPRLSCCTTRPNCVPPCPLKWRGFGLDPKIDNIWKFNTGSVGGWLRTHDNYNILQLKKLWKIEIDVSHNGFVRFCASRLRWELDIQRAQNAQTWFLLVW